VVFEFCYTDDEIALIETPRQVEDSRVSQEAGISFRFQQFELTVFADQAAVMIGIMNLAAILTLVCCNGDFSYHASTLFST
jgi:hypothetical protein